jgi:Lipopolysaccharide kinase (Kdo/WaaP) family
MHMTVSHDAPPSLDTSPITLDDGWKGEVLTRWPTVPGSGETIALSVDDWREPLRRLVTNSSGLDDVAILKASGGSRVLSCSMAVGATSLQVVCKQSSVRSLGERLSTTFRGSRERRNWNRARRLLQAGIATAVPLAIVERSSPRPEGWLVSMAIAEVVDLERIVSGSLYVSPERSARSVKNGIIAALADLCGELDRAGLRHRDFKASNVLVTDHLGCKDGPVLWLVDLDGIHPYGWRRDRSKWSAVVRLAASLEGYRGLTRSDRLRFLRTWLGAENESREERKQAWRKMSAEVADYNRRARHRKRGKIDGFGGE